LDLLRKKYYDARSYERETGASSWIYYGKKYYDVRSYEREIGASSWIYNGKNITMHGPMNVKSENEICAVWEFSAARFGKTYRSYLQGSGSPKKERSIFFFLLPHSEMTIIMN
jgi:hypothetical protein